MSTAEWKREYGLWDAPKPIWTKLTPDEVGALIESEMELPRCADCKGPVNARGARVFADQDGLICGAYCAICVRMYAARKAQEALQAEILKRVGKGRSKGLLSKELVGEGRRLADVRLAFDALLEDGRLVQVGKGIVRPSRVAKGQMALLDA